MCDVSVIGCGKMGSALIEALRDAGNKVTIWNRTHRKAEVLAGPGVEVADSVGEALVASPVSLVCVSDYGATREVLDGEEDRLAGRTLVQLSNGPRTQRGRLGAGSPGRTGTISTVRSSLTRKRWAPTTC